MSMPFISVVIPAFNSEKTIEGCINSLLCQDYPKNKYEVIVVDNGSTDNTFRILKKMHERIRIFREPEIGSYNARNLGAKNAKGKIIAFTDSDCVADKKWLFCISKAFEDKSIRLVGGNIKAAKSDNTLMRYCDIFSHSQEAFSESRIPFFAAGNMAVRAREFKSAGMFNPVMKSGGDLEFCSRLIKSREEIFYEPGAVVRHNYEETLSEFIKKQFLYGKWHKFMKHNLKLNPYVKHQNYIKVTKYDWKFLSFRILQDISFKLGTIIGKTPKYSNPLRH